jgi:hypothetical protein
MRHWRQNFYADLGVAEVWIYDGEAFIIKQLQNGSYKAMLVNTIYAKARASTDSDPIKAIDYFVEYINEVVKIKIYKGLDFIAMISQMKELKNKIPDQVNSNNIHDFAIHLREKFLVNLHVTSVMVNLSKLEFESLENYLYCCCLLIECERAAVRRTPEVWSQIEERLLRPAATTN